MTKEVEDILARHKNLTNDRRQWEAHWQELAEIMLPRRADFTGHRAEGEKRTEKIFDSTPMQARRGLSSAIDGLLKPKTGRWFSIEVEDEDLNEGDEVKAWLEDTEKRLFKAIYNPRARFVQRSGEVDDELVTFGTGCLFIEGSRDMKGLLFRSITLKRICIAENSEGAIDTIFIDTPLTARQAEQRFGRENIGEKTREAVAGPDAKPDKVFGFLQVIQPRHERDPRRWDNLNLPFSDCTIDVESRHKVSESGFHEFPCAIPRWDTASDELYGRSPAMIALGDSLTLQAQAETVLKAGQKEVDPPLLAADDSVFGNILTYPGGITHFDLEAAKEMGGPPVIPLNTGANIPLGREMQQDSRDLIWAAFFRNVLQLPTDAPKMTATEVLERREEFVRTIGPVFGRLEADYIAVTVERSFNIMMRSGLFGDPPDVLRGRDVQFKMVSPVEKARKQIEAAGVARTMELLAPFIQFQPELVDNFDGDEIARDAPDIFGMPKRWIRSKVQVDAIRSQKAQQQQAAALLAGAGQAAQVAEKVSKILLNSGE